MSPERHIERMLNEIHELNEHRHLDIEDARLKAANVELAIHELRKVLEKGENYEHN